MWIFLLISSTAGCLYFEKRVINDYFEFNVITSTKYYREIPMRFPVITICSSTNEHDISQNDISINCTFNSKLCNTKFFSVVHHNDKNCLRFNEFKNETLYSVNGGILYGLNLEIDFYMKNESKLLMSDGLDISIHNNSLGNLKHIKNSKYFN